MRKLIIIFISSLLVSTGKASVDCLKLGNREYIGMESVENVGDPGNIFEESIGKHQLMYLKDSCSSHGCQYFIFSEAFPGCRVQSLHQNGFLLPGSFKGSRIKIRQKLVIKKFQYSLQKKTFMELP